MGLENMPAFSPEGVLNRQFGKNKNEHVSDQANESETETLSTENKDKTEEDGKPETYEGKPIMAAMVSSYRGISKDPETSALNALYDRLDSNLSEEEKMAKLKEFNDEYKKWQADNSSEKIKQ